MSNSVLDASAVLAHFSQEPGGLAVAEAIENGALISTVNWAEVLSKVAERGITGEALVQLLKSLNVLGSKKLQLVPLFPIDTIQIAQLRPLTRSHGLSLGDRACVALALRKGLPVLTADRRWEKLDLDLKVVMIR